MRKIFYILPYVALILFSISIKSQEINWGQINSNNAFNIINIQNPDIGSYDATVQIGNHNSAELQINDRTKLSVTQIGDYNKLLFNNSFTETKVNNSITTQGHNNIIDITGSNSISDDMKINVKGDNVTIFMRNY
ncbi:hypothetical protein D3C87_702500 [compost metagenome]